MPDFFNLEQQSNISSIRVGNPVEYLLVMYGIDISASAGQTDQNLYTIPEEVKDNLIVREA